MSSTTWRLLPSALGPGALQIATDAWLLEQLIAEACPPTLRFYRWSPPAVSLGYHQKDWPSAWRSLTWQGQPVDLVRRPTGGRAVLHQGDLTYAIVLPLSGSRQDAYHTVCDALIAAWGRLGVELHYGTAGRGYRHQQNCFALATAADLVTATGYKLIGSAQLRRDRCLLQHGSMRLCPDLELHRQVFGEGVTASPPPTITAIAQAHQRQKQLEALITEELARSLNVTFTASPLTHAERAAIAAQAGKFAILPNS